MPRQMFFEEFMDRPTEAGHETIERLPREERDKLVGLIAKLMGRAIVPEHCPPPADDTPQAKLSPAKEVADHE